MAETKYEARLKTLYNKEIAKGSWLPLVLVKNVKTSVSLKP